MTKKIPQNIVTDIENTGTNDPVEVSYQNYKIHVTPRPVPEPDFDLFEKKMNDPFSLEDFRLTLTDSSCPFSFLVKQIEEPGMEYLFERNTAENLSKAINRKWNIVEASRLQNNQQFTDTTKGFCHQGIVVGDTILLERDARFGEYERKYYEDLAANEVVNSLSSFQTHDVRDVRKIFDK